VLLIGLAYLAAVYWASPALRRDMRCHSIRYGQLWWQPPRTHYRVGTDLALKGFEERLIQHADATQHVRMTMDVTTRWRDTIILDDGDPAKRREELGPLRERHCTVTFLLGRGPVPSVTPRMKLVVERDNWWCAWLRVAGTDRYLLSIQTSNRPQFVCRSIRASDTRIWGDDEGKPIVKDYMIPLWPFVSPSAFHGLLNGRRVSRGQDAEIGGRMCRSVRIETRWERSTPSACTLWMPKGEDRVVKVEYVPAMRPEFVRLLTDEQRAELGTVCIVTGYEEPGSFTPGEFDPAPVLERWAEDVGEAVAYDVREIGRRGSGGFGGPGFGEETDTESAPDDGDAEEGAAQ
jgi:hypothetical protein